MSFLPHAVHLLVAATLAAPAPRDPQACRADDLRCTGQAYEDQARHTDDPERRVYNLYAAHRAYLGLAKTSADSEQNRRDLCHARTLIERALALPATNLRAAVVRSRDALLTDLKLTGVTCKRQGRDPSKDRVATGRPPPPDPAPPLLTPPAKTDPTSPPVVATATPPLPGTAPASPGSSDVSSATTSSGPSVTSPGSPDAPSAAKSPAPLTASSAATPPSSSAAPSTTVPAAPPAVAASAGAPRPGAAPSKPPNASGPQHSSGRSSLTTSSTSSRDPKTSTSGPNLAPGRRLLIAGGATLGVSLVSIAVTGYLGARATETYNAGWKLSTRPKTESNRLEDAALRAEYERLGVATAITGVIAGATLVAALTMLAVGAKRRARGNERAPTLLPVRSGVLFTVRF